jgi:hypothetical protein
VWDGNVVTGQSVCSAAQSGETPCAVTTCAAAGDYVVTMCAVDTSWDDAGCVAVPFHYPTDAGVVGQAL